MSAPGVEQPELENAIAGVEELDETVPLAEHVDRFERVHQLLEQRLGDAQ